MKFYGENCCYKILSILIMRRSTKAARRDAGTVLSDSTRAKRRKERMSRNEQRGKLFSNNCTVILIGIMLIIVIIVCTFRNLPL